MSSRQRTNKKPKGYGYDFQGRRPPYGGSMGYGSFVKQHTHRMERRQASTAIREQLDVPSEAKQPWEPGEYYEPFWEQLDDEPP
jgi:hypothetical protein